MDQTDKQKYQEKMEAKLTKLKADIDHLEAELKDQKADPHAKIKQQLQRLREQGVGMKEKLHDLKAASGSAWDETKIGVARAWRDLEDGLQRAGTAFKR